MRGLTGSKHYAWMLGILLLLSISWVGYRLWRIEVLFESEPSGAVVRVDGRGIGLTPLVVALDPGRHRIELTHSHFVPFVETLSVQRGDRLKRLVTLTRGIGRLQLLSNPRGAWVELNGERLEGLTPLEAEAPTGPAEVRMGLLERRIATTEVIVLADQTVEVNLELNIDPHGSLTVAVEPADALVTLPELDLDYRPGLRVPIGEQLIRVARSGYQTQQIRYDVRYDDNYTRISLNRAQGPLEVRVRPQPADVSVTYEKEPGRTVTVDYKPGMQFPIGRVEIRALAIGYRSAFRAIKLTTAGATVNLNLQAMDVTAGERFTDKLKSGGHGPLLVVIPGGEFIMGDPAGPPSVQPASGRVLAQPFAMSVTEVSVAEYRRFAEATSRGMDAKLSMAEEPARYLSWQEAVAYTEWLTQETGAKYRLPTEAEWEYAARAGSRGDYYFGAAIDELCAHANLADLSTGKVYRQWQVIQCDDGYPKLAPVGSYPPNDFGLHDMLGNVSEWVLECGIPPYEGANPDGTRINSGQSCATHGVRGGSWDGQPEALRVSRRGFGEGRSDDRGIRLLREL